MRSRLLRLSPSTPRHLRGEEVHLAFEVGQQEFGVRAAGHVVVERLGGAAVCGAQQVGRQLQIRHVLVDFVQSVVRSTVAIPHALQLNN